MTKHQNAIALITPLKDEIDNIQKFLDAIGHQSIPITCLVIVENDSIDGSREYLEAITSVKNVGHFKVLHINFEDTSYRVGKKYATIINEGMQYIKTLGLYEALDFVGILDCDVFPEKEYYGKLTAFLNANPEIGIASGLTYTAEGVPHIADKDFVRGNSRLWKRKCLEEAGYPVVYTADTVSVALAHLKGWKTKTLKTAIVTSREIDTKLTNSRSKGYHAYFRGHTLFYMALKFFYYAVIKGRFKTGYDFFLGYFQSMIQRKPRIGNREVRNYFRWYLLNKLTHKFE